MVVIWKVVKSGRVCAGNPILLSEIKNCDYYTPNNQRL